MFSRITIALLSTLTACVSIAEPVPFRAVYKADYKGLPVSAVGIRELKRVGDNTYSLSMSAKSFFATITESSTFTLNGSDPVPKKYLYNRSGIGKEKNVELDFDWNDRMVRDVSGTQPLQLAITDGTFDKLLYQLKMREDLKTALAAGDSSPTLTYKTVDGDGIRSYEFSVDGEEVILTPIGAFTTLKVSRVRQNSNRTTTFWLAPAFEYMLVRFEQIEENGKGFELLLKEAEIDGKVMSGAK